MHNWAFLNYWVNIKSNMNKLNVIIRYILMKSSFPFLVTDLIFWKLLHVVAISFDGMPPSKFRSRVWQYATPGKDGMAKCSICKTEIRAAGGNTTNIITHLKRHHQISLSTNGMYLSLIAFAQHWLVRRVRDQCLLV